MHTAENAVSVASASNIEIRNSVIRNNSTFGIFVGSGSSNVRIHDNRIQENTVKGLELSGSQVTVENNLIRNSDRGIGVNVVSAGTLTVRGNDIFGHNYGMELTVNNTTALIDGNTVHDNAVNGIRVAQVVGAGGLQIVNNEVYGQSGSGDVGIWLNTGTTVRDNLVHHNAIGIDAADAAIIDRNRIYYQPHRRRQCPRERQQLAQQPNLLQCHGSHITGKCQHHANQKQRDLCEHKLWHLTARVARIRSSTIRFISPSERRFVSLVPRRAKLRGNVVQANVGTLVSVATGGQAGFVSDYNDLFPGSGAAKRRSVGHDHRLDIS